MITNGAESEMAEEGDVRLRPSWGGVEAALDKLLKIFFIVIILGCFIIFLLLMSIGINPSQKHYIFQTLPVYVLPTWESWIYLGASCTVFCKMSAIKNEYMANGS